MIALPDLPGGEIHLLRGDDGSITVEHAGPTVWFNQRTLEYLKRQPLPSGGWAFDGTLVTLDVANGRWIWKLTGREWMHDYGNGAIPLVMCEGAWPD